jgi:hypothetical protein
MTPHEIQEARNSVTSLLADFPDLADDEQLRADMIEGATSFNDVIRRLVIEAKTAAGKAEGVKITVKELSERKARLEHQEERIRALILSLMQMAGLRKLPLPEATLSVTDKKPQPLKPDSVDGLPDEFIRVTRDVNMAAIHAAYKEGRIIDGIAMSNGGVVLQIRS